MAKKINVGKVGVKVSSKGNKTTAKAGAGASADTSVKSKMPATKAAKAAKAQASTMSEEQRLDRCGALFARAIIFARAGDPLKAGTCLIMAAADDEAFDQVADGLAQGFLGDETMESGSDEDVLDDIQFEDEMTSAADEDGDGDDEDDDEEDEGDDSDKDDDEEVEGSADSEDCEVPEDTAPAVRRQAVDVPASVVSLARKLSSNRY
jgi:cobalamin biosynthesis protein CobT